MITRRRFLEISAAMAAVPGAALARPHSWQGFALGAKVTIRLQMPGDPAPLFARIEAALREIERAFSLYDPVSDLVQLNRAGRHDMSPHWAQLLPQIDAAHQATRGLFDPGVQSLWRAQATGRPAVMVSWSRARWDQHHITLAKGQSLTFNGIAQGYATDHIRKLLARAGLTRALVNIGEYSALGGPFRLGIADPAFGHLGHVTLEDAAIATSSPGGARIGEAGHILHPTARPHWSTVSVVATTATCADALSTALCLAPLDQVHQIRAQDPQIRRITLVAKNGDVATL